ncbi:acyltransferase [Faecalicoccus acidiformans]|uniref:acyltransferase n=1 Tax=Faecalicoccus acidiformans TaxID=915173 RepID=UPI002353A398|nr:acyltransferase [Faecalicoccus acidiformans]
MVEKINKIFKISIFKAIYYNFFCKNVIRKKGCYIIPFKNLVLDFEKGSKLFVNSNLHLGINKLKHSKAETLIRLKKNAIWEANGEVLLFYGTTIEVLCNAKLISDFFSANTGSVIIVGKQITIGYNAMLGRNIIVYDSDHHQILDYDDGKTIKNHSQEVIIGDNVWLTNNITVLKGVSIAQGSIIAAGALIRKDVVAPNSLVVGDGKVVNTTALWSRDSLLDYENKQ